MAGFERGDFENPKKSAYSVERYDSSWEMEYMKRLDRDKMVAKWTKPVTSAATIPTF